jgi:hypothetical protein
MPDLADLRWRPILAAALVAFIGSLLMTVLIVTGYAFTLGFQARGAPDPSRISAFAERVAPTSGRALLVLFTAVAAWWVARRVTDPIRHGVVVGLLAAVAGLLPAWPIGVGDAIVFALVVGAGWIGARAGVRPTSVA